jgi:hypothetical protein
MTSVEPRYGHVHAWEEEDGRWVPACPEPWWVFRFLRRTRAKCECGLLFKTRDEYREHWKTTHRVMIEMDRATGEVRSYHP